MPRYATRRYVAPRRVAVFTSTELQAPIGGLNARDSVAEMKPSDMVRSLNFWPTTTDVVLRDGYVKSSTGLGAQVNGIFSYNAPTGTLKRFASASTNIYDITAGGAVGAAVVSGLSSADESSKWQHTMFATTGGTFLYLVNGVDDPRLYDGTAWTAINGASTPAVTGVTTNTLINLNVFKTRLWFVQKDTLLAWYLPAGSIGGAATSFDLRPIFKKGGYLVSMATWTIDAGAGMDDYAVFVTSEGELAVYQGTDPASASTFALKGVFQVGNPIGRRCFDKFGGDLTLINRDGLIPLSKGLLSDRVTNKSALTDKINQIISRLTMLYSGNYGWETQLFPQQQMLLLNIPVTNGQIQCAMNTQTGAWTIFIGWNATCFERSGEDVYFGGNGYVGKIWQGKKDDVNNIMGDGLQAFSKFSYQGNKFFKMARPIIYTDGGIGVKLQMNVNYNTDPPIATPTFTATTGALWDVALWDVGVWGGDELKQDWQTVGNIGYTGALAIAVVSGSASFRWEATQFVYEHAYGTVL